MDRATVIVAIPPLGDKIHKISSEAIPHMTLLYLGDVSLSEGAVLYVQHACEELSPFGASVDYRGKLGPDDADVLFFEDSAWDLKRVKEFRHYLLLNDEIKAAYDTADQYPEWTPHLTLGYPAEPAREVDGEDNHLGYISFDRIAVWTGDFEGPEFRLKYDDYGAGEVAMSDMTMSERGENAVNELFHFGVKGMKWGVHKSEAGGGGGAPKERGKIKRAATKANVALDAGAKVIREGEKKLIFLPAKNRQQAASRTQTRMLAAAAKVNRDPKFKGKDIKNTRSLKRSYFDRLQEEAKTIYAEELGISRTEAWGEFLGVDTSVTTQQMRINAAVDKIRHADMPGETLLVMNFITDADGFVTDIEVPDEFLKHEMFADNELTLTHYGVKGMKWGVRNDKGHEGEKVKTKHLDKLDKQWEADMNRHAYIKLHNAAADAMNNGGIDKINNKPEYKDVDFNDPANKAIADKYYEEHHKAFEDAMVAAGPSLGMNPSGTKQFVIKQNEAGEDDVFLVPVEKNEAKHAEGDKVSRIRLKTNDKGVVEEYVVEELELKHYGVKGMRWGVTRNADGTTSVNQTKVKKSLRKTDQPVTVTQKKAGTYVKAKGGTRQTASQDAVKTQAARQKAKRSTTDSLSTKELKDTIERMRLEQEFAKLDKKVSRKGSSFISRLMQSPEAKQAAVDLLNKANQ